MTELNVQKKKKLPDAGQLILYRNVPEEKILESVLQLAEAGAEADAGLLCGVLQELIELAAHCGLRGNLWNAYLAYVLANHENAFSRACEITGPVNGSLNELALHYFAIFREWMSIDVCSLGGAKYTELLRAAAAYVPTERDSFVFNHRIRDRICELADRLAQSRDEKEFCAHVTSFLRISASASSDFTKRSVLYMRKESRLMWNRLPARNMSIWIS